MLCCYWADALSIDAPFAKDSVKEKKKSSTGEVWISNEAAHSVGEGSCINNPHSPSERLMINLPLGE